MEQSIFSRYWILNSLYITRNFRLVITNRKRLIQVNANYISSILKLLKKKFDAFKKKHTNGLCIVSNIKGKILLEIFDNFISKEKYLVEISLVIVNSLHMTRRKFFLLFVRKFSFTRHVIRLSLCKILTNFIKLPAFFSHFV